MSEDAEFEFWTVATLALAVRHSATRLDLIQEFRRKIPHVCSSSAHIFNLESSEISYTIHGLLFFIDWNAKVNVCFNINKKINKKLLRKYVLHMKSKIGALLYFAGYNPILQCTRIPTLYSRCWKALFSFVGGYPYFSAYCL